MTTAILVEDEYLAREELKYLIHKYSTIEIVAEFDDGLKALEYIQGTEIDIAFLDINIPSVNGMLLAKSLYNSKCPPKIIFTTAYREHAAEAFDIEAFDYILKPFSELRVQKTLEKIEYQRALSSTKQDSYHAHRDPKASVNLYQNNRIRITPVAEIIVASANGKITEVVTQRGLFTSPMMLSDFVNQVDNVHFFRVHRSYWINLNQIEEIIPWASSTYRIKLNGTDTLIPVSRSNIKPFRDLMGL
ncbi:LytR/AlgR family response regulator transcription factor [Vibrio artabrorum]|uniref:LytTR family DNA-binding domain-containing protein n=1 Tax=Vibrio artabrorum TaxID=446374 RepID=A0ABT8CPU8_9VIBR|nr:LytTR family DNA-binding domain-containing protein [Vibrio artabrorum]MDN3702461.1 LytTR family DNA-binding domain-containing protein [Vibrio artabrorum]